MTDNSPIKNLTDIKSRVVDNERQLQNTHEKQKESLKEKARKEKEFKGREDELSELDKQIKKSMIDQLQKIPDINEKQAKEDDRTTKISNNIQETKEKIKKLNVEISGFKEKKQELEERCAEMRKQKEFLEQLRQGEEDIGDIQQLLEKWKRLTDTRKDLAEKNTKLEESLEAKKNKYQDIFKNFLSESLKQNNLINEVDKQLNANSEQSGVLQQGNQRENINDKINELQDLFTKLEQVLGRWDEVQKEMKNIVVTNTKKDEDSKEKQITIFEMKRTWEDFRKNLELQKEDEQSRARSIFQGWDRVRDLNETLISNKGKYETEKNNRIKNKTEDTAPSQNNKLEMLVRKQETDLNDKIDKLKTDVERELGKMSISIDPNELVSGETIMDKLQNAFVKIKAVFEKIKSSIKSKFTSKTAAKKEESIDEEDKSNAGEEKEKEDKDKKDKKQKDNSDEMLSKKWDDLKMKLEKIKVNFENLNKAQKVVTEGNKKREDN